MRILKKISLAVAAVAVLSTSSFAGQVLVGGNVPLISNVVGLGVLTLDLTSDAVGVNIATFIINTNSPQFNVSWTLENGGFFMSGAREIAMTGCAIAVSTSNIGTTGATDAVTEAVVVRSATSGTTTAPAVWSTLQPLVGTENYMVAMNSSWTGNPSALAGLYTEQINFTILATL